MFKGHSAGIGDLLRSSAAWRALKNRYPQVELHLLLLSKDPGYTSERFIARHHLLSSFLAKDRRTKGVAEWRKLFGEVEDYAAKCRPDLIIDFESNGLRTSLFAFLLARKMGVRTIGINEVPLRGIFYSQASIPRRRFYAQREHLRPIDYTDRDFVPLSVLGIERGDTAIELQETEEGREFRRTFRQRYGIPENARLVGLNIGCGTPDAEKRRPSLPLLAKLTAHLHAAHGLHLVVGVGAPFEANLDEEFLALYRKDCGAPVTNLGGKINLFQLGGLMRACDLFVSGDTGPYHMAVAFRTPTLAVFNRHHPSAYHHHPWVKCIVATQLEDLPQLVQATDELLKISPAREFAHATEH